MYVPWFVQQLHNDAIGHAMWTGGTVLLLAGISHPILLVTTVRDLL